MKFWDGVDGLEQAFRDLLHSVYINGEPVCARPPNKIGEYAELGNITRDIVKAHEVEFLKQVEARKSANGGKLEVAFSYHAQLQMIGVSAKPASAAAKLATLFPNASKIFDAQFDGGCGSRLLTYL